MYFGLVHILNFDTNLIDQIRRKYDPTVDLIAPHITILFPVPDKIHEADLIDHTSSILINWKSFTIHIHGLYKSWDHWLFLCLEEGNKQVKQLNHEIYSGPLLEYKRWDIEFIPHISLGLFVQQSSYYDYKKPQRMKFDKKKYGIALKEAASLDLDFSCEFDRLQLLRLSDDFSNIEKGREFLLD